MRVQRNLLEIESSRSGSEGTFSKFPVLTRMTPYLRDCVVSMLGSEKRRDALAGLLQWGCKYFVSAGAMGHAAESRDGHETSERGLPLAEMSRGPRSSRRLVLTPVIRMGTSLEIVPRNPRSPRLEVPARRSSSTRILRS